MNVFDFALKMELDGERYYRELAANVQYPDLKVVLEGLADDEHRHYTIVQSLAKQIFNYTEADPSLSRVKNVFELSKGQPFIPKDQDSIAKLKEEQVDLYHAALAKEEASVLLYRNLQGTAASKAEKDILEKLMREEERHAEVLGNIIQMFNQVHEWVESAEFHHTKPY